MAHIASKTIKFHPGDAKTSREQIERISHDFRTPLNIISGFAELLLDEVPGKINEEQRRSLNDILSSSQRLLKLVDEIFSPSAADSKKC
jgi:signal transduction histidine kinase